MPVAVRGLRELNAAFAKSAKDTRLGVRKTFRAVAEPVRRDAETLAQERIPRVGDRWYRMRTGVTRTLVYVAPRQRGVKWNRRTKGARQQFRRPNMGDLLMDRAMEPALEQHRPEIEAAVERALDQIASDFNHGGPV